MSLLTILASILVFGFVILFHELGHFFTAKKSGIQVNEFSIGMGPALWKKVHKGTQYSVRLLPIGGFVSMEGEDGEEEEDAASKEEEAPAPPVPPQQKTGLPFGEVAIWKRMVVIAAGAVMNLILGYLVMLVLIGGDDAITSKTICEFSENALCQQTGLAEGDTILAVNGRHCFVANDILYELQRSKNYTADFTVRRNGQVVELPGVQFDTVQQNGQTVMQIGFKVYAVKKTVWNVLREAGSWVLYYMRLVFMSLADVVTGHVSVNELSGPVGIVSVIGQAVRMGADQLLNLLALLTVNLGIFNLLPFPALDGGRLVLLGVEAVIRRPVPQKVEIAINALGMACLLGLIAFATFNDILRLLPGA